MSWTQVPATTPPAAAPSLAVPWALASVPPSILALRTGQDLTALVPVLAAAGAALVVARWRPPLLIPAALAVAAILRGVAGSWPLAVVVALGVVVWGSTLGAPSPARSNGDPHRGRGLAVPPGGIAVATMVLGSRFVVPAVLLGLATFGLMVAAALPAPTAALVDRLTVMPGVVAGRRALRRATDIAAGVVGRAVLAIAVAPVALVVLVIWAVDRLTGHDRVAAPAAPGTSWVRRLGVDAHPDRHYAHLTVADDRPPRPRLSAAASSLLLLLLVVASVAVVAQARDDPPPTAAPPPAPLEQGSRVPDPASCPDPPANPVLDDQPDYRLLACETGAALSEARFYPPAVLQLTDFDGQTVQVRDGVRRTWRPPPCDCRRLRVWWLGGSAAWGQDQRDAHTLPSMLARAAWEEGVALDIENHAMPTYVMGQEVHRLADLVSRHDPPDLVVFYNGGNDLVFQGLRASAGRIDDSRPITLHERTFDELARTGIAPLRPEEARFSPLPEWDPGALGDDDTLAVRLADAAIARYGRDVALARLLGEAIDRPVAVLWQPLLAGSPAESGPPDAVPEPLLDLLTTSVARARATLPDGVIDMAGAVDDVREPIFSDLFHTGEEGARIMAAAVLDALRPALADAVAGDGGP